MSTLLLFMTVKDIVITILVVGYIFLVLSTIVVVLLDNGDPAKTTAWILVLVLLPVVGIVLYGYFGQNFRKRKLFSRKRAIDFDRIVELTQYQLKNLNHAISYPNDKVWSKRKIMALLLNNNKALLSVNNNIKVLQDGKVTFEAIFSELEKAQYHIHLEYYIFEDDELGERLKSLLIKKAVSGVEVRLMVDGIGSFGLSGKFVKELKEAGVEFAEFLPVRIKIFANKINHRNHRKIIVIDGKVGFVGGINVSQRYIDGIPEIGSWRDTHLMIHGEAVEGLQTIFMMDWFFASRKKIYERRYFNIEKVENKCLMQVAASGPDSDWASIMQTYFTAINTAKEYVYITTPYFLPNESILTALKTAGLSGVDVRLMLPYKSDSSIVNIATRSYIAELLEANVRVYFYIGGFSHSKVIISDDVFCSIGSANMDMRSFDQNFEVNAILYNEEVAKEVKSNFLQDLEKSAEVEKDRYENRSFRLRFLESIARLFTPLF